MWWNTWWNASPRHFGGHGSVKSLEAPSCRGPGQHSMCCTRSCRKRLYSSAVRRASIARSSMTRPPSMGASCRSSCRRTSSDCAGARGSKDRWGRVIQPCSWALGRTVLSGTCGYSSATFRVTLRVSPSCPSASGRMLMAQARARPRLTRSSVRRVRGSPTTTYTSGKLPSSPTMSGPGSSSATRTTAACWRQRLFRSTVTKCHGSNTGCRIPMTCPAQSGGRLLTTTGRVQGNVA
mmetsp:Transcript_79994/g.133603  ORF Transcript_79994/g.133603 Transcript_79994/m.133603 type:complete len:236 (+) Transcript_79994:272-979(+)